MVTRVGKQKREKPNVTIYSRRLRQHLAKILKMEDAMAKFWGERSQGGGVREEDAQESIGMRL